MDGIDISGAEKCMGVPVAAQPVGQAVTCTAPHAHHGGIGSSELCPRQLTYPTCYPYGVSTA